MSDETREPQTFEDLWLMRATSNEWFDGQVRYKNVRNGSNPEVGAVDSVSWHVVPSSERVHIIKNTHVISEVRANGHSFSCRVESETVAEYHSMDEFRDSEWWDLTMGKFAGGGRRRVVASLGRAGRRGGWRRPHVGGVRAKRHAVS